MFSEVVISKVKIDEGRKLVSYGNRRFIGIEAFIELAGQPIDNGTYKFFVNSLNVVSKIEEAG